jgi:YD repeat-containing protein
MHKVKTLRVLVLVTILFTFPHIANAATYVYDNLHRLTSVTYNNGQKVTYTYDAAGNITSATKSTLPKVAATVTKPAVTMGVGNTNVSYDNTWVLDVTTGTLKDSISMADLAITGLPTGLTCTAAKATDGNSIVITVAGTADQAVTQAVTVSIVIRGSAVVDAGAVDSAPVSVQINPAISGAGATISGLVRLDRVKDSDPDPETSLQNGGVTVTLCLAQSDGTYQQAAQTVTAADGSYSFTGVAPGSYALEFNRPGWTKMKKENFAYSDQASCITIATGNESIGIRKLYLEVGDMNGDGVVSSKDLTLAGRDYNKSSTDPDWSSASIADVNGDGVVSSKDLTLIGRHYGQTPNWTN